MNIIVKKFLSEEIKIKIENGYKNSISAIPELHRALKSKRKELGNGGSKDLVELINLAQFTTISSIDFQILLKNFLSADNDLEISFYSRVFATTILGFLDGINPLIGKNFRRIFLLYMGIPDADNKLQFIYNEIKAIKKGNENYLREIRNNAIAHKDIDAQNQITVIEGLDSFELMQLNLRMVKLSNEITNLLSEIIPLL